MSVGRSGFPWAVGPRGAGKEGSLLRGRPGLRGSSVCSAERDQRGRGWAALSAAGAGRALGLQPRLRPHRRPRTVSLPSAATTRSLSLLCGDRTAGSCCEAWKLTRLCRCRHRQGVSQNCRCHLHGHGLARSCRSTGGCVEEAMAQAWPLPACLPLRASAGPVAEETPWQEGKASGTV